MNVRAAVCGGLLLPWAGGAAGPPTCTVSTTRDAGPGSLREALNTVNRAGGPAVIAFNIPRSDAGYNPTSGTWTITFLDTPPPLTASGVVVDGAGQTAAQGDANPRGPEIVLSGNRHTVEHAFCLLDASNCVIRGFAIGEFIYGIQIHGAGACGNVVAANHLGVDAAGEAAFGNYNGVEMLSGAHHNTIGGARRGDGNLISGNLHIGVKISDAHRNIVVGNRIGVDRAAARAIPNYDGVCVEGRARGNRVGGAGAGERNIISGNVAYGVDLFGWGVTENVVLGNYIGTDLFGEKAVPNTYGVLFDDRAHGNILGGAAEGEGNLISGNTAFGAYGYNNGTRANIIRGNRIGTDAAGLRPLPNETGVHLDGGTVENIVDRNLISGNLVAGVTLFARLTDRNRVTRNLIGVDRDGRRPLGNGADGVRIAFGPADNVIGGSPEEENLIAHNGGYGIRLEAAAGNRLAGNTLRDNARGDMSVPAPAVPPPPPHREPGGRRR